MTPRWLVPAFVLAVVLALLFSGNALRTAWRLDDPPAPVEAWMTPGYIVHSYGVDPSALAAVLKVEPGSAKGKPLAEIAKAQGVPVEPLLAAVEALRVAAP